VGNTYRSVSVGNIYEPMSVGNTDGLKSVGNTYRYRSVGNNLWVMLNLPTDTDPWVNWVLYWQGRKVQNVEVDSWFWKNVSTCLKVVAPLMVVLWVVDSDTKPAMGFIY